MGGSHHTLQESSEAKITPPSLLPSLAPRRATPMWKYRSKTRGTRYKVQIAKGPRTHALGQFKAGGRLPRSPCKLTSHHLNVPGRRNKHRTGVLARKESIACCISMREAPLVSFFLRASRLQHQLSRPVPLPCGVPFLLSSC